ncbi:MAG: hypothetical protein MRY74_00010 [Neomegalonema sp.]|nr:hypothetical protein [Neomegalonema sp.]
MCMFKAPKPAPAPPPPPPPPEEPPVAPVFDTERIEQESSDKRVRRIGRSALRVDLQAPSESGAGLQTPQS